MAQEDEIQEEKVEKKPKKTNSGNPLLTLLLILNCLMIGGIGYFQYVIFKNYSTEATVKDIIDAKDKDMLDKKLKEEYGDAEIEEGILFPLESFIANLAQGDGPRRYIRLNAVLKFNKDSKEEEFKARKPQIRDAIINILNSKRAKDLLKAEGKTFLKEEIRSSINSFLVDSKVIDVYYVSFQIN